MPTTPEKLFRQRFCQASNCGALLFICSRCDRGQRYCSSACRKQARREQWRAASRRHQQSPQGRLDHRDRQRSYRQREAASTQIPTPNPVTHQGSQTESTPAILPRFRLQEVINSATHRLLKPLSDLGLLICQFCEQQGRFVNPFQVPI